MRNFIFWACLFSILLVSIALHFLAIQQNAFHFTVDQGRDAIYVRDLIDNPKIIFRGPETSIPGVYVGSLWYYFIAFGYLLFHGNPIGPIYQLIFLHVCTLILVALFLRNRIGDHYSLLCTFLLSLSWQFFETALWSFNPFPLVSLAILFVIFLNRFFEGNKKSYFFALIPVLLSFHSDIAAAAAFMIIYFLIGMYSVYRKTLKLRIFLLSLIFPLLGTLFVGYFFLKTYVSRESSGSGLQIFAQTNGIEVTQSFSDLLTRIIFPTNVSIGLILISFVFFWYFARAKRNNKTKTIIHLSLFLIIVSYLFFASNQGYRDWHIVYVPPLFLLTILLMVLDFAKNLRYFLLCLITISTISYFSHRLSEHRDYSPDPTMLYNELSVLDWIYTHNDDDGFNVYIYTDRFYDYPYQYLFWWYGREKYGFMPCEYSNYPKSPKNTYVPNYLSYSEPQLGCNRLRFLIIESETNGQSNANWMEEFRKNTSLIEQTEIGEIKVEKRGVK